MARATTLLHHATVGSYNVPAMTHGYQGVCAGILSGVLLVSSGCTRSGRDSGSATPDFFPLHAEDTWVYEVIRPMRNSRTRMTVRVRDEHYVETLGRRARMVDESYAADDAPLGAPTGLSGKAEIYPIAYYRRDGFLYRALSLEYRNQELHDVGIGSAEERFLPDGLGSGLSWDSITTAYDLGGGTGYDVRQTHRAVLEAAAIEVPAGRFSGVVRVDTVALHGGRRDGQYDSDPIVLYYSDWYAPNIGLVRTVQSMRADGGPPVAEIALLAYDVEGAKGSR